MSTRHPDSSIQFCVSGQKRRATASL